jgi:ribosomal protein L19E
MAARKTEAKTPKLAKIDLSKLTTDELDKLSHGALREAVRSVIRDPNLAASHKDHRSHSSVDARILTDKIGGASGGGG